MAEEEWSDEEDQLRSLLQATNDLAVRMVRQGAAARLIFLMVGDMIGWRLVLPCALFLTEILVLGLNPLSDCTFLSLINLCY